MNSLYTLGVRQTNSIQADLERLRSGDASASLIGQLSARSTPGAEELTGSHARAGLGLSRRTQPDSRRL
jgi:hypothetical protein